MCPKLCIRRDQHMQMKAGPLKCCYRSIRCETEKLLKNMKKIVILYYSFESITNEVHFSISALAFRRKISRVFGRYLFNLFLRKNVVNVINLVAIYYKKLPKKLFYS